MTATPQEIAAELQAASDVSTVAIVEVFAKYFAEKVNVMPSLEADMEPSGVLDAKAMVKFRYAEIEATSKAMPGYTQVGVITAEGDNIHCAFTISGTPVGEELLEATVKADYGVADGKIVSVALQFPEGAADRLFAAMAKGGFVMPAAADLA